MKYFISYVYRDKNNQLIFGSFICQSRQRLTDDQLRNGNWIAKESGFEHGGNLVILNFIEL